MYYPEVKKYRFEALVEDYDFNHQGFAPLAYCSPVRLDIDWRFIISCNKQRSWQFLSPMQKTDFIRQAYSNKGTAGTFWTVFKRRRNLAFFSQAA